MSILNVKELKAYYVTEKYGHLYRVKAVDGVSFQVKKDEI